METTLIYPGPDRIANCVRMVQVAKRQLANLRGRNRKNHGALDHEVANATLYLETLISDLATLQAEGRKASA
jgi:hypothetical protein